MENTEIFDSVGVEIAYFSAKGVLCQFDVTDICAPLDEISAYLTAKWGERFKVHPARFEDVVAEVFKSVGYDIIQVSHSHDDGIDIAALNKASSTVGIQVKRTRNVIEASQNRELAGSLTLDGLTKGVFVTTSHFSRGSKRTCQRYLERGLKIELMDASKFYDAMRIMRRGSYNSALDPTAPFYNVWQDPNLMSRIYVVQGTTLAGQDDY